MSSMLGTVSKPKSPSNKPKIKTLNRGELISQLADDGRNTIFFCGAGFSKAWDSDYPTGMQLFAIDTKDSEEQNFFKFARDLEIVKPIHNGDDTEYNQACYDYFKAIKFHLDTYKRYPSLMPNYIDLTTIDALEAEIRDFIKARFVEMVDSDGAKGELELEKPIDNAFTQFFTQLFNDSDGAISFITTNYDFIIEKIIYNTGKDISLNRGVVDRNKFKDKQWHQDKINLFKLNGGFEISQDADGCYVDYGGHEKHRDNIILPSPLQNYNDSYFDSVFIKSANKLREANLLIFIGYSMPEEDHTIRFLLKNFNDSSNSEKEIVVIGSGAQSALKVAEKVKSTFVEIGKNDGVYAFNGGLGDLLRPSP